jgi:hypothetical protein
LLFPGCSKSDSLLSWYRSFNSGICSKVLPQLFYWFSAFSMPTDAITLRAIRTATKMPQH